MSRVEHAAVAGPSRGIGPMLRQALAACCLMIASGCLAVVLTPTKKLAEEVASIDLASAVPRAFGEWKLDDSIVPINPSPDQAQSLAETYDQLVSYTYVNARGQHVMLSIAYGSSQKQGLRAHRQEVCYRAQGFQIRNLEKVSWPLLGRQVQATQLVARYGARVEPVTYWFTMGDHVVRSYVERQLVQLQYALAGYIPDGYLFRVSTLGANSAEGFELQRAFSEQLLRAIPAELEARLIGSF